MYKLPYGLPSETRCSDTVIFVKDEKGKDVACFGDQFNAFDYIKTKLEKDKKYEQYIKYPDMFIMEIYRSLDNLDKKMIQNSLVQKYRNKCMYDYFNQKDKT